MRSFLATVSARLAGFPGARHGIASVEFALIVPLLTLLLFGTIEVGRMISDYQAVTKGVRDATRYLTRVDGVDCTGGTGTLDAARLAEARNLALSGRIATPSDADYRLTYWTAPESVAVAVTCQAKTLADGTALSGIYAPATYVPQITVTANVNFLRLFGDLILAGNANGDLPFAVAHTQLHIGE